MSHKVNCPYKTNESLVKLPCEFMPHPHDANVMFCQSCGGNEYDIRDIVEKPAVAEKKDSQGSSFWPLMGVILILLIGLIRVSTQPRAVESNQVPINPPQESRLSNQF